MAGRKLTTSRVRFDEKCLPPNERGCVEWTGWKNPQGYGCFYDGARDVLAHRWAYAQVHGPILAGLKACHSCDNPACVNHEHIFLGTQKDNLQDCSRKGRVNKTIKVRGDDHPNAKTDWVRVTEIRRLFALGHRQCDIAKEFQMTNDWVNRIVRNKSWRQQPQGGFTLIELMVVVAIVGILAAIGLPAYLEYTIKSKWASNVAEVEGLKTAIKQCLNEEGGVGTACDDVAKLQKYGFAGTALPTPKYGGIAALSSTGTSVNVTFTGTADAKNRVYSANCGVDPGGNIVCTADGSDTVGTYIKGTGR